MKRDDFSWMIGGAQGSGVDTPASIFAKAVATTGFNVYGTREYYSNIKGEHSYFQVRFGKGVLRSHVNTVDMLATFDDEINGIGTNFHLRTDTVSKLNQPSEYVTLEIGLTESH